MEWPYVFEYLVSVMIAIDLYIFVVAFFLSLIFFGNDNKRDNISTA